MLDLGNVRVVGMSQKEVQKAFKLQEYAATGISSTAPVNIYMFPQGHHGEHHPRVQHQRDHDQRLRQPRRSDRPLLRAGQRAGLPRDGAAAAFGDCGVRTLVVTGPTYKRVDISAVKRTRVVGHTMFEFRADMINAFNHPNFVPVVSTSTNADNWRVTAVQENSNRTIQLVMRFSW